LAHSEETIVFFGVSEEIQRAEIFLAYLVKNFDSGIGLGFFVFICDETLEK
jgi:hypothetical protein